MNPKSTADSDAIEDLLSDPLPGVVDAVSRLEGDFMVLGVGGKMGTTTARMLRRAVDASGRAARVIGVARFSNQSAKAALERNGIETLTCDLASSDAVAGLPECANVLYLAGQKFGTDSAPEATWIQNAVVPAFVARKFAKSRIVVFSTGCVYPFAPVEGPGCKETEATALLGEYAVTCLGRERVFTHYSKANGTPMLLFRLNYAVELRYGVLVDIAVKVMRGEPVDVTTGHFNFIWQGDAVAQAIRCLELVESPPRILNVTGQQIFRVREIAETFAAKLGRPAQFTGRESAYAWLADSSEAVRAFGAPTMSSERIIDLVAEHIRGGGELLGKPTHFETRDGKF